MELRHSIFVHKLERPEGTVLYHSGTGEIAILDDSDSAKALKFDVGGVGYLDGDPIVEVSAYLRNMHCRGVNPKSEKEEEFFAPHGGKTSWRNDLTMSVRPGAFELYRA